MQLLRDLGALRIGLLLFAIANMLLSPFAGTSAARSGWQMISTLVAPAMAPLIFFVLLFDYLMCRVRIADAEGIDKKRFQKISRVELVITILLLVMWSPYFLSIGR